MTARVKQMVEANWFHRTIVAVILLAGVLAGLETSAAMRERHDSLLRALDALVLGVFIVEMALKLAVHGRKPWLYFRDGWNIFDFVIVLLCCLPMDSQFAAVLRLARGLRLLRLVTALPKLQLLVGALLKSLGAMGYVTLLLALMFYTMALTGTLPPEIEWRIPSVHSMGRYVLTFQGVGVPFQVVGLGAGRSERKS